MADVKESALTQKSDCKWVRALDANGNSIRISKEDLASVVGELLTSEQCLKIFNKAVSDGVLVDGADLNEYCESKHLFVRNGATNSPDGGGWWYVEIVKFINRRYIVQRATSVNRSPTQVWSRSYIEGTWYPWTQL